MEPAPEHIPESLTARQYRQEQELWAAYMEIIPDTVYFKDIAFRFTKVNDAQARVLGVSSPDAAIGKSDADYFTPEHAQKTATEERQIVATGKILKTEENVRLPDGTLHIFSTIKVPLRDGNGAIIGIAGSSRDITDQKRIEAELRRMSEQQTHLLDISQSILAQYSLDDVIRKILEKLKEVTSFDACGLYWLDAGKGFLVPYILMEPERISPKLDNWPIPYGQGIMSSVLMQGKGEMINNAHRDPRSAYPEGVVVDCEHMISYPIISRGEPLGVMFASRRTGPEYTRQEFELVELFINHVAVAIEHARLFDQVKASEERYRELFEESRDVVFISSPEGRFIDINQAGVTLFGYSRNELFALDIGNDLYLDPIDRKRYMTEMEHQGFVKDFEISVRTRNGETRFLLETSTPVRDKDGTITGYRGILRDVTEVKGLEKRLLQAQKLESLGTLAGGIAHDFNNILAIIIAYISRMERGKLDGAELAKSIDTIKKASWRGAELVRRILTFARKTETVSELLDLNIALGEIIRMLMETMPRTILFERKFEEELPRILADSSQFHQAIVNLCVNARDAMPDGGTISMTTILVPPDNVRKLFPEATKHAYVAVEISDTGTGMTEEVQRRIFEPFFTTKEQGKGTGLGLAMVYGIVQNHHGFISVHSEVGKGTTFTIYLPVPPGAVTRFEKAVAPLEVEEKSHETLLVVEDETMLRDFIQIFLETKGYTVLTAGDGIEAINLYKQRYNEIALVFTDMGLPGMNGWEMVRKMREVNPSARVIFATGYLDPEMKMEILKSGVQDFIHKPYLPEDIQKKIREVLASSKP